VAEKLCPHCSHKLADEREQFVGVCFICRRFALLRGQWPEQVEERNMTITLSDAQIVRLFELCEKIGAVLREIPPPPQGLDGSLERAKNLRSSLDKQNGVLIELGTLLR
jgi:hypothetical protein